ncbi:PorP/SprF family type IX secretion system membrane protein [Fulvivirga sediminis]|uniref:PorP/SprF family type IX secretion system membrane protein n=1 Tax=Fulvivirga sediminis TaxID=2803949 RepID=A0A937K149_9BACT|nr:PorP/SprF family type IX secretion system membrane protein [Fulvivirga sediminis]MBL3658254.1 PorP/SprF family type IX secretion system membrane protein [Fulvivirga sediminis]
MINFKKSFLFFLLISFIVLETFAQEANYSMFHYTPFFTNPGQIGTEQDVRAMLNYRNQNIEAGDNFSASSLSLYYPILIGNHRLVLAGSFLHDKASDFLNTNGGLLGVAYSIRVSEHSELSLGIQGGYFSRKTDGNFVTDDQFENGVFDPNISSSDGVLNQTTSYPTLSGGIHYLVLDDFGREKAFLGAAMFNAIEPNISLIEDNKDKLPLSLKATAGYQVYQGEKFSVLPNLRWINQAGNNYFNIGSRFGYELDRTEEGQKKIELGLWYNTNDLTVFSIAYEQPNITIGLSYDLPISTDLSAGQNGIFELAFALRLKKKQRRTYSKTTEMVEETESTQEALEEEQEREAEQIQEESEIQEEEEEIEEEEAEAAIIKEEPAESKPDRPLTPDEVLTSEEKKVMARTVRFELDSDDLDQESKAFLDQVYSIVKKYPQFDITLTGHTCNLGEAPYNQELSIKRAEIVRKYLSDRGVDKERIRTVGKGETLPIASNDTESGREVNRRVEFELRNQ